MYFIDHPAHFIKIQALLLIEIYLETILLSIILINVNN